MSSDANNVSPLNPEKIMETLNNGTFDPERFKRTIRDALQNALTTDSPRSLKELLSPRSPLFMIPILAALAAETLVDTFSGDMFDGAADENKNLLIRFACALYPTVSRPNNEPSNGLNYKGIEENLKGFLTRNAGMYNENPPPEWSDESDVFVRLVIDCGGHRKTAPDERGAFAIGLWEQRVKSLMALKNGPGAMSVLTDMIIEVNGITLGNNALIASAYTLYAGCIHQGPEGVSIVELVESAGEILEGLCPGRASLSKGDWKRPHAKAIIEAVVARLEQTPRSTEGWDDALQCAECFPDVLSKTYAESVRKKLNSLKEAPNRGSGIAGLPSRATSAPAP